MKGRIRSSKPELWKHWLLWHLGELTGMPKLAFWYDGLWHWTDREGRFEWNPQRLKTEIAPYDAVDFERALNVLANGGFIIKYRSGPRLYGWVPRFSTHQSINGKEEASRLPEPPRVIYAIYDEMTLKGSFAELTKEEALSYPPIVGEVQNLQRGNDLQDASRVDDATSTRDSRVAHADSILFHSSPSTELEEQQKPVRRESEPEASRSMTHVPVIERGARALPAVRGQRNAIAVRDRLATVFAEIAEQSRSQVTIDQLRRMQAEMVFLYWTAKFTHPNAILDKKREQKIVARLAENDGNVSELLYALDGAFHDEWTMGRAANSPRKYDDIVTVLRDRGQVERFAGTRKSYREGKVHKLLPNLEEAMRRGGDEAAIHEVLPTPTNGSESNGREP